MSFMRWLILHRLRRTAAFVWRLARNERGAEAIEKLLILAVIALPLLFVLVYFKDTIVEWLTSGWDEVAEETNYDPPSFTQP